MTQSPFRSTLFKKTLGHSLALKEIIIEWLMWRKYFLSSPSKQLPLFLIFYFSVGKGLLQCDGDHVESQCTWGVAGPKARITYYSRYKDVGEYWESIKINFLRQLGNLNACLYFMSILQTLCRQLNLACVNIAKTVRFSSLSFFAYPLLHQQNVSSISNFGTRNTPYFPLSDWKDTESW